MQKNKIIKAWAVLDVDGGIKYPGVSIYDTKKEAQLSADKLNKLPNPTNAKDPKNYITKVEIILK